MLGLCQFKALSFVFSLPFQSPFQFNVIFLFDSFFFFKIRNEKWRIWKHIYARDAFHHLTVMSIQYLYYKCFGRSLSKQIILIHFRYCLMRSYQIEFLSFFRCLESQDMEFDLRHLFSVSNYVINILCLQPSSCFILNLFHHGEIMVKKETNKWSARTRSYSHIFLLFILIVMS